MTREPGGTELGEQVRQLLLDPKTGKLDARAEALLFAASRAQTVTTIIRPALAEGKIVICDRYVDSSLAYQGWARGLGEQDVLTLNVWATQGLFPDLVILLHVEPELGLAALDRGARPDGAGGPGLPREGLRRVPEDRGGAPGAVRRDGCRRPQAEVFESVKEALERVLKDRDDGDPPRPDGSGRTRPGSIAAVSAVLDRVPGQEAAMAFLTGAAERPHHAYVFAGPEGSGKSIAARAFAAALLCPDGRVRRVPALPAGARGPSPERVPGRARGPRHPRGHHPRGGLDARLPDRARAGPQGVPDPRGGSPVARRGRHAAEGAGGAARRHRASC